MNLSKKIPHHSFVIIGMLLLLVFGCKKDEEISTPQESGTITDIDGTIYKTIKIGNQWWMAEDLRVSRFRNGDSIPIVLAEGASDNDQWKNDSLGACCDFNTGTGSVSIKYYNWYAINNASGLAPAGWHIPSDAEWKILEQAIGMSAADAEKSGWRGSHEGEKLKVAAPTSWTRYGEIWATNESGFTALANGCRLYNGEFGYPGPFSTGYWWSSTEHSDEEARYRYLDYKNAAVFRSSCRKTYGFNVRCVKD